MRRALAATTALLTLLGCTAGAGADPVGVGPGEDTGEEVVDHDATGNDHLEDCGPGESPGWDFVEVAPASLQDADSRNRGVVAGDLDGDGDTDIFAVNPGDGNRLLLNRGDATFAVQVEGLGPLAWQVAGTGGDYDGDGDLDIFLSCGGFSTTCTDTLLRNDGLDAEGALVLTDVSAEAGVGEAIRASFGATFVDVDLDGDLDLHVAAHDVREFWQEGQQFPTLEGGDWGDGLVPALPDLSTSSADLLYINQGDGTFTEEALDRGLDATENSHQAAWLDVDSDGDLDAFVPAFWGTNLLFLNEGGHFENATTHPLTEPERAFAVLARDFDNSGTLDLLVAANWDGISYNDLGAEPHRLFLLGGGGVDDLVEVGAKAGLDEDEEIWPVMGFQAGDIDLNGVPDVLMGNGFPQPWGGTSNRLLSGHAGAPGVRFEDRTAAIDIPHPTEPYPFRSHGLVLDDLDGDGDIDIFVGNGGLYADSREPNRLFLHRPTCRPGLVRVILDDPGSANRFGVGARLRLADAPGTEATWEHWEVVQAGSGFNSSVPMQRTLGTDGEPGPFHLTVVWPGGGLTELEGVERGSTVRVEP